MTFLPSNDFSAAETPVTLPVVAPLVESSTFSPTRMAGYPFTVDQPQTLNEFVEAGRERAEALEGVLPVYRDRLEASQRSGDEGAIFDARHGVDHIEGGLLGVREAPQVAREATSIRGLVNRLEGLFIRAGSEAESYLAQQAADYQWGMRSGDTDDFIATTSRFNRAQARREEVRHLLWESRRLEGL